MLHKGKLSSSQVVMEFLATVLSSEFAANRFLDSGGMQSLATFEKLSDINLHKLSLSAVRANLLKGINRSIARDFIKSLQLKYSDINSSEDIVKFNREIDDLLKLFLGTKREPTSIAETSIENKSQKSAVNDRRTSSTIGSPEKLIVKISTPKPADIADAGLKELKSSRTSAAKIPVQHSALETADFRSRNTRNCSSTVDEEMEILVEPKPQMDEFAIIGKLNSNSLEVREEGVSLLKKLNFEKDIAAEIYKQLIEALAKIFESDDTHIQIECLAVFHAMASSGRNNFNSCIKVLQASKRKELASHGVLDLLFDKLQEYDLYLLESALRVLCQFVDEVLSMDAEKERNQVCNSMSRNLNTYLQVIQALQNADIFRARRPTAKREVLP
ncbi:hypothetical protein HDU84_001476 [Entophlyctis sp. JEL0112]|nr:hypothetical protein HDU84_001476 [Entophlyctis sp. JEL0112]